MEEIIGRVAERKIQEAIDEGKFDNLPGKGKPLELDDDPLTPAHLRMANRVLKNAGVLPDWMQVHKELDAMRAETEKLRERLLRDHARRYPHLRLLPASDDSVTRFAEWHARGRAAYLRRLKAVNTQILKLSLMAPGTVSPPIPYVIDEETKRFDAAFPPLPQKNLTGVVYAEPEEESSRLRALARERYGNGAGGGPVGAWAKAARLLGKRPQSSNAHDFEGEDIRRSDAPKE